MEQLEDRPEVGLKPFLQVYKESWDRNLKVWPLFAWQVGIELLRVLTVIPCVVVAFLPLAKSSADFAGADFSRLSDTLVRLLWQSGWWKLAAGMFVLYMVWWLIIEALVNGGVFGRLWAQERDGEGFDFKFYLQDGFRFFLPLVTLHLMTFAAVLGVIGVPVALAALLGSGAGPADGSKVILAIALLLLALIPALLILAVVAVWWLVARGFITRGHGLIESFQLSYRACRADKGRVFWGLNVLFLLLFAGLLGIGLVFGLLQAIPILGVLFSILNFIVSTLSAAFMAVYVPSVVISFLGERN